MHPFRLANSSSCFAGRSKDRGSFASHSCIGYCEYPFSPQLKLIYSFSFAESHWITARFRRRLKGLVIFPSHSTSALWKSLLEQRYVFVIFLRLPVVGSIEHARPGNAVTYPVAYRKCSSTWIALSALSILRWPQAKTLETWPGSSLPRLPLRSAVLSMLALDSCMKWFWATL